ncbi:nitrate reductase [Alsobacter soli]|uniref:Nitrate reductase n=1 Tax=Alsobacter soli TaxID=2109933 RepID=A0A2T1HLN8_9HYPH|nr:SUMF1/EgtB/PvdO family nonheme iron enzyme [Alsobacter soli]PSC02548.1 nitrate reductase [Alsobacter soli]
MFVMLKANLAAKAVVIAVAPVALAMGGHRLVGEPQPDPVPVVRVEAGEFAYRVAGDFNRAGRPVNAPVRAWRFSAPIEIMKSQVSAAEYDRCVAEGACERRLGRDIGRPDVPAVGVSWQDASAYAAWFSRRTGQTWRLPTDSEWAYVAGSRFKDDAVEGDDGTDAFTKRWLAKYEQESARAGAVDKAPRPIGAFGENERGVADLSGNVWEWTNTCFLRQGLDAAGEPTGARTVNCGVRVVEGEHRAYVTDFIRDAKGGGCAVGVPPANLGFRLVREHAGPVDALVARVKTALRRA